MKVSPKMKKVLAEAYGLQPSDADVICDEMNGLLRIHLERYVGDHNNVFVLVSSLINAISTNCDVSEKSLHNFITHGFSTFLFYCTAHSISTYSRAAVETFLSDMRTLYQAGKFGYWMWTDINDCIELIRVYHETASIQLRQKAKRDKRELCVSFEKLLDDYKNNASDYRALSPTTIRSRLSSIRVFLWSLERCGTNNISKLSHKAINESITMLSPIYSGGLSGTIYSIRLFLSFLYESGMTSVDYTEAIPQMLPRRAKMHFGFTKGESADILSKVNRLTAIGKRDYAIMLISARTGLRACDIASLKRTAIDWQVNEIRIVQQKTGVALTIPLTPEVGNAIIDYFYNARGESDSEYIFVKRHGSHEHITNKAVSSFTTKYMKRADVDCEIPHRGIHSFRRSFGKRLLDASLTADMLMEMLGQVDVNSVKPYSAIDENGLKHCALSLSSVMSEVSDEL